eukprot:gene13563-16036_t
MTFDNKNATETLCWTACSEEERDCFSAIILHLCRKYLEISPEVEGIDTTVLQDTIAETAVTPGAPGADELESTLVSDKDEKEIEKLLQEYGMDLCKAANFEETLRDEIAALEGANVHALLECHQEHHKVLELVKSAQVNLDDLEQWLMIFSVKLTHMRKDIDTIESRNNRLELQARNNAALLRALTTLVDHLVLPE